MTHRTVDPGTTPRNPRVCPHCGQTALTTPGACPCAHTAPEPHETQRLFTAPQTLRGQLHGFTLEEQS